MIGEWQDFLQGQGAAIEHGRVLHYGEALPAGESLLSRCVVADLSHWGVIAVRGEDAAGFLQGQLTSDIREVTDGRAQIGGYCTPKGRLLATFYIWKEPRGYCLCLPAELVAAVIARLDKFRLRARVQLHDAGDEARVRIGLAGAGAPAVLQSVLGAAPRDEFDAVSQGTVTALRLPGAVPRFLVTGEPGRMGPLWDRAREAGAPVGAAFWEWLQIRAGVPMIRPETEEKFVPQMVNLDALHGISFKKGCYTGQEIVARMHYLGRLKQRMYLARLPDGAAARPGDLLYSADADTEQSAGTVVAAQPAPDGGQALLAVIGIAAAHRGNLRLHTPDGPNLTLQTMPYELPTGRG